MSLLLICRQQALFHVLAAYSVYNTEVGYCQGMSEIAALILMYTNEEVNSSLVLKYTYGENNDNIALAILCGNNIDFT
jgi:hypothetical protein